MRLILEILLVGALIYVGWDKPFHDWLPNEKPAPVVVAPVPKAPAASQPAWMHDPNHRTPLDTPRPNQIANAHATPSSSGSWLFDSNHHSPLDPPAHASASPH